VLLQDCWLGELTSVRQDSSGKIDEKRAREPPESLTLVSIVADDNHPIREHRPLPLTPSAFLEVAAAERTGSNPKSRSAVGCRGPGPGRRPPFKGTGQYLQFLRESSRTAAEKGEEAQPGRPDCHRRLQVV
jgi:hypothetical protein